MKIMDLNDRDEECQIESVISPSIKKGKQARLPFQTISADSQAVNKKRKSVASPDCRLAKQPKVTTKENSFASKKIETEVTITEEKEELNKNNETDNVKDSSKEVVTLGTPDTKNKKSIDGKGSVKSKKSESKVQVNSLTKFFKKIDSNDNKEIKNDTKTSTVENSVKEIKNEESTNDKSKLSPEKFKEQNKNIENDSETHQKVGTKKKLNFTPGDKEESDSECKKNLNESCDIESKDSSSSDDLDITKNDTSQMNETDAMDVDSDSLSDDSQDDDDSDKSDDDQKKSEHEDAENTNKTDGSKTPSQNKLFNATVKLKKLTPKQLEKKKEIQKKRDIRQKEKLEKQKMKQEQREIRRKEKEEKKREREEKEKLLKEQKRKEKELKELKRQVELEQKQKEKEAKEEDRRKKEEAKEEEKRRKEEERLEAERKKLKAASNFVSFFVAKKPSEAKPVEEESKTESSTFMPFEIKADMRIAPVTRRNLTQKEKLTLEEQIKINDIQNSELYISEIKDKNYNIRKSERTWPDEAADDVVILEGEDEESSNIVEGSKTIRRKHRAKLLLFEENRRPPYWGTWRKKSKTINPRRPFSKDTQWFDYEVDSDEEWEEEESGESLRGSDDEKEKDEENAEENEYDVDNDFMVPHGYLSDEEIGADEEDEDEMNPETQKTKLKLMGEQFEAERNTKTKKLKPKVIGCIWLNGNNAYPENTPSHTVQFLTARQVWIREIPLTLTAPADADNANDNDIGAISGKKIMSARKAKAIEEAMPDLIRLVHGNTHNRGFLVKEFLEYWSKKTDGGKPIPKSKLLQKVRDIAAWMACPDSGPMHEKHCWYVSEEFRAKYLPGEQLTLPNRWEYILTPKRKSMVDVSDKSEDKEKEKEKDKEKEKRNVPLITQFTKTLTAEEKRKQLAEKAPTPSSKLTEKPSPMTSASKLTPPLNRQPKRASLISVPRGEPLPKSPRVSLIDKFITNANSTNTSKKDEKAKTDNLDEDDCMIIDVPDEKKDN